MIRNAVVEDAGGIIEIYNHYIKNTTVTFEEIPLSESEMKERIEKVLSKFPFLVYEENGKILGYSYATEWRIRSAYKFSVESTVYVGKEYFGRGFGRQLYEELLKQLKEMKIHSVIGGIAIPNPASIALHEKCGFKKVAHFKEVGWKFQHWIDVGYWELIISEKDQGKHNF